MQIEHAIYEYSTWVLMIANQIIDVGKFGPNTKICSDFFLLSINSIKDTHKEKAPSNKTPVLRKSTNKGVWAVGTLNQLFIRGY